MVNILFENFNKLPSFVQGFTAYLLVLPITMMDYFLGPELSTTLFYLFPIALLASSSTKINAVLISFVAALLWLTANVAAGQVYDNNWVYLWNFSVRLILFLLISRMIHASFSQTKFYAALANIDDLTGILNRRGFLEKAQEELSRAKRFDRAFSLAFIDLDNFKDVNDQFGHQAGDELLKTVAIEIRNNIRSTDQVGRMGGDEFAVLFVESDQQSALVAFEKCHQKLTEKIAIQEWPVSISAGVVTYTNSDLTLIELIEKADEWMYHVKKAGKNNVIYKYDTELQELK
tara:strand:+ start:8883 stop:9749 length:867 start_codon:yes stop_codon:yes gene_type:complete